MSELIYPHVLLLSYYSNGDRQYPPNLQVDDLSSLISLDKYEVKGYRIKQSLNNINSLFLICALQTEEIPPDYDRFYTLTKQLLTARELEEKTEKDTERKIGQKIGQTLILIGYLPPFVTFNQENCQKAAQSAYENLGQIKAQTWSSPQKAEKFGAQVFSLGETPIAAQTDSEKIEHILIFIYRDRAAIDAIGDYYQDWLQLYCYYHLIVSSYRETRAIKADIKNYYSPALVFIENPNYPKALIECTLEQLEKAISESALQSSQYTEGISSLETRKAAIETNLDNYTKQLKKFSETDKFSEIFNRHYLPQIKQDITTLTPGLRLHETWVNTLRGMVEIQRAKSDRDIEASIGAAGVGAGVSSAVASATSALVKDFETDWSPAQNLTVVLSVSLLCGLGLGLLTFYLLKKRRSR
ncbi:hypothetical protein [Spirulina sp. 06S082]|uniref:hypothetical protein n=1 Tax=Spirulina sp. 06S082 TaxID=3110248 RepID=UPI002B21925E|nr:hypothetical protein [Spirulina sp. 06S082]MEA5467899.1 hypothetical protein [Spirulina sp. 06S082]